MERTTVSDEAKVRKPLDRRGFLRRAAMTAAFTAPMVLTSACGWVPKIPKK